VVSRRQFAQSLGAAFAALYSPRASAKLQAAGELELSPEFRCFVISRVGDRLTDGYRSAAMPDGMACFAGGRGELVLMRNHEVGYLDLISGPYPVGKLPPTEAFDKRYMGGVSRLVLDADTLTVKSSNYVLLGTARNCAGGISPWGWLTCEESVEEGHGYVFACDHNATTLQAPNKIAAYGRFNHEAAVVDPTTNICYLTEDRADGCFYRFVPTRREEPFVGRFQALRVVGRPGLETGRELHPGPEVAIDWVDVDRADSPTDDLRLRARALGAAVFARGEGIWLSPQAVYFSATIGGTLGKGQIFAMNATADRLRVVAESTDITQLNMPDNLTVHPSGHLFVAEDSDGRDGIKIVSPQGTIRDFARNALSTGEIAGLCFDPGGTVLFANLQTDGLTVAIRGPFENLLKS
jgi:secreted PhoX family phosphatase